MAGELDGFQVRPVQQAMAEEIDDVLARRDVLVCEAGTGTGKTLAYLVPVLRAGLKTILSTATKPLQDQLFYRDLPVVRAALDVDPEIALLKGRQNYLCLYRMRRAQTDTSLDSELTPALKAIESWSRRTVTGDLEQAQALGDNPQLRYAITASADNCLGGECPDFEQCFVFKARRAAVAADIVVVNHHLLFADMVLRDTGFAELLPTAEAVVLDEAHKLADIASVFFSRAVSGQQLQSLIRDGLVAAHHEASDTPELRDVLESLELARKRLHHNLERLGQRPSWQVLTNNAACSEAIDNLITALASASAAFEITSDRGVELGHCYQRCKALAATWELFVEGDHNGHVLWAETSERNFTFYATPISVAQSFWERVEQSQAAWVLTSATLAVGANFEHFRARLGLSEAREALWLSPFDYARQALLYLPPIAAEPRADDFEQALLEAVLPVLVASRGRAFFLFTSYRSLERVADMLAGDTRFELLTQGQAPRAELLRRFELAEAPLLLGTASFWEGVDVRGEQLSCVIIDKLPFAVPDDPVTKARSQLLSDGGGNPFREIHLPEAITTLKQGAGRLIRDVSDRGVLVIGDRRLHSKGYGKMFLKALPPMPVTRELADVEAFFAAGDSDVSAEIVREPIEEENYPYAEGS